MRTLVATFSIVKSYHASVLGDVHDQIADAAKAWGRNDEAAGAVSRFHVLLIPPSRNGSTELFGFDRIGDISDITVVMVRRAG
ncbi:MAG: hypothetical protein HY820_38515 [Acidobacteria bacterium]|nr:hypothetical protein [Acidobacteriota bacterium]